MILDTNALSAFAEADRGIQALLSKAKQLAIPSIVLGEYTYGIRQSRSRNKYELWLTGLTSHCRVLAVDATTANHYADVRTELKRAGRPIPTNDLWIAALARQHSLPLVSRDRHFEFVPHLNRLTW